MLDPAVSKNLFFVADGTGGHVFAETYAEHQRNVANYWRRSATPTKAPASNTPAVRPTLMQRGGT